MATVMQFSDEPSAEVMAAEAVTGAGGPMRLGGMIGRSLIMQRLFSRLRQTAPHLRIAAIEGEPGTGKALTARTLHSLGPASAGPFVACAATRFMSSETQSLLEEARGGALLISRVNELTAEQQGRLVDFLEWWEHRSGRDTQNFLPRQLFFSSSMPLRQPAAGTSLRSDLTYRLTAIRFELPPLRERRDDIAVLAEWFATRHGAAHGKQVRGLGPGTLERLLAHEWPGNVRELETILANAAMDCPGQWIRPIDLPRSSVARSLAAMEAAAAQTDDDPNLDRMILRHIVRVLERTGGNKLRAAQLLGISRSTLYRLLDSANRES